MRRSLSLVLVAMMSLMIPGPVETRAADVAPDARLRAVWIVAGGAAAEARYRVMCQPEDGPVFLRSAINQDGQDHVARGYVTDLECTGDPLSVTLPLQAPTGTDSVPVREGEATVSRDLSNCLEHVDPCYNLGDEEAVSLERRPFRPPFSQDFNAALNLVRSRLTGEGDVRLAFKLICSGEQLSAIPVETVITQVSPRGRLVRGSAEVPRLVGDLMQCGPDVLRLRTSISPSHGARFREGKAFLNSSFGSIAFWGVYATDVRPVRLARAAR